MAGGDKAEQYVVAPQGLFPSPIASRTPTTAAVNAQSLLMERFLLLGRAAAKALQDGRLLDIQLSYLFFKCAPKPYNLNSEPYSWTRSLQYRAAFKGVALVGAL